MSELPYDPMTEEDAELLRKGRADLYRIDEWGRENLLWLWSRVVELEADRDTYKAAADHQMNERLKAEARITELERESKARLNLLIMSGWREKDTVNP